MRRYMVLGMLAGASACVEDPGLGAHAIELQVDEGALPTSARPEVGQFFFNGLNRCTASLIAPRVAITAAHCLQPQYTAIVPLPDAAFTFTDLTGMPRSVPVLDVHSFATKRWEWLPIPNNFTSDVALLHLQYAVPSTWLVPMTINWDEPLVGQMVTIFGWGCPERSLGAPDDPIDTKRYATWFYGPPTLLICWGDSGGPAVLGGETEGGALWGVNSDWIMHWADPEQDIDVWGSVPFYRRQIEDVMRAWDGLDEAGFDRPGLDLDVVALANVGACRSSCQNHPGCAAFTWVPSGSGGMCWRKHGASEPIPAPGLTSGLPVRFEPSTNRAGSDLDWLVAASADQCAQHCGRHPSCRAWTWVNDGTCWRKTGTPAPSACGVCTSGVVARGAEANTNRPGHDLRAVTSSTAWTCAQECVREPFCEAYTFTGGSGTNNCWLKSAVPPASHAVGMTSGVRRGYETNTRRIGSNYRTFTTNHLSPAACQAQCAAEWQCQSWTYIPPPSNGPAATCELKNAVPARTTWTGYVSGIRGLEMLP